ncbi:MAG: long-chain fatty acid--CoA ligase, partial [Firmicutes bacterium]|nr:long-chain fatty acid--CoA ligase [Bacillota bacterium]
MIESTMMEFPLVLPHILERTRHLFGEVEVVSVQPDHAHHRYHYRDFYDRTLRLANALSALGLHAGDRVATLMWNHYVHLESYFAIPSAGYVLHTLNLRLHPEDIAYLIHHAEDQVVIVDDVLLPLWQKVAPLVSVNTVVVVPWTGSPIPDGAINYETWINGYGTEFSYPSIAETAAAGMCYTSGTTGKPKGVVYSHRALILQALSVGLGAVLSITPQDTVCPIVPMFHINAWGIPVLSAMVGARLVFPGPYLGPAQLLQLFSEEQVTKAVGIPTIWMSVLQEYEKSPAAWDLSLLKEIGSGGAPVPEALIQSYDSHGIRLRQGFGMTETAGVATFSVLQNTLTNQPKAIQYTYRAKAGMPIPLAETRVVSLDGDAVVLPQDNQAIGELQVRGPFVARSYYNRPDTKGSWTEDGWFRTGDVAAIDDKGYVRIVDRTKDLIKSGGEWISSVDLENALMAHPGVKEAAVIGVPHPTWQERPIAAVVLKENARVSESALLQFISDGFPKWWLPDRIIFLPELPKTSTGKFLKTALRE